MKIGVELEFFICHKSDETFYMPDIISRYLKYNSGFISMQKDSNGICIKAKNELGVTISFEFTYSIIEFSIDPQYDILSLHSIINTAIYDFSLFIDHYELMLISHGIAPFNIINEYDGGNSSDYINDYKRNKLTNPKYCIVGDSSLFITYNGDILGCFQDFSGKCIVANIRNSNLKDIIKHKKDKVGRYEFCSNCNSNIAILNID